MRMGRVCMLLFNSFRHDARVLKEAQTLAAAGCTLTLIALRDEASAAGRERHPDGFDIVRIPAGLAWIDTIYLWVAPSISGASS
jgi:hypothetical protein